MPGFPDLSDNGSWSLVDRSSYSRQLTPDQKSLLPIPPQQFTVAGSRLFIVGIDSQKALDRWWLGGWATQYYHLDPGGGSLLPPLVAGRTIKVELGNLTQCLFDQVPGPSWTLEISFPKWLPDAEIEIWQYIGTEDDSNQFIV